MQGGIGTAAGRDAELTAADVMNAAVRTVEPDTRLQDIGHSLLVDGVGAVAVTEGSRLVGVVSRSGILEELVAEESMGKLMNGWFGHKDDARALSRQMADRFERLTAREVMREDVVTVSPLCPVPRIASTMVEHHVHRVFVTRGEELIGVVSMTDLIRLLAD